MFVCPSTGLQVVISFGVCDRTLHQSFYRDKRFAVTCSSLTARLSGSLIQSFLCRTWRAELPWHCSFLDLIADHQPCQTPPRKPLTFT